MQDVDLRSPRQGLGGVRCEEGDQLDDARDLGRLVLVEQLLRAGDPTLVNPYHVMVVNPAKHPESNTALARSYGDFLVSADGQRLIGAFRVGGEVLFRPSAGR